MPSNHDARVRTLIAQEAARIILDEGLEDFRAAKRKAAERIGVPNTRNLPRNSEIEHAVLDRQRLFSTDAERDRLQALRQAAVQAMRLFERFRPRLVGSVLKGTAHAHSDVNLHLFAASVEDVTFMLMDAGIPFRNGERRLRQGEGYQFLPTLRFMAGDVEIEAVVFPEDGIRQAPPSPVDGRPMQRASITEVERLLAEEVGGEGQGD